MKIIKYKKLKNNKYQLTLDDESKIDLYEDVILNEELLLKKEVNDLEELMDTNNEYSIYDKALKYISLRLRSIKELKEYLIKKEYSYELIEETIAKLKNNGYLNDSLYSKSYINDRMNLSIDGPLKIEKYLQDNFINEEIYDKYLRVFTDKVCRERINKYLDKQYKINKKSNYIFKNKMIINLLNLGYSKELIMECINSFKFNNEKISKEKEKEKLYKKLSSKYSGQELERKVQEKLYQKGFFE